eukprot:CAMPEP_0172502622 /NCGR_PEP_ID=MMETSP1066-20121228/161460_1 /TAXON_ID=671091 /ORGANISM="Coscinodiscus wailesii, Strain CCMP2513" /LENGTH=41 /DNA_ID= /DNA_START= /DNA_END= /DNA_ORIENTATION=
MTAIHNRGSSSSSAVLGPVAVANSSKETISISSLNDSFRKA